MLILCQRWLVCLSLECFPCLYIFAFSRSKYYAHFLSCLQFKIHQDQTVEQQLNLQGSTPTSCPRNLRIFPTPNLFVQVVVVHLPQKKLSKVRLHIPWSQSPLEPASCRVALSSLELLFTQKKVPFQKESLPRKTG